MNERVLTVIPFDSRLTVDERSGDGQWARVRYAGRFGWVSQQYLAVVDSTTATGPTGLIWPVESRQITSQFGPAQLGIDIDQFQGGTPAVTAAACRARFAGGDVCCRYGLYVIVDHGGGVETLYAHLRTVDLSAGQTVGQGQVLGKSGSTGLSIGPHLHFEVNINGVRVNPLPLLAP